MMNRLKYLFLLLLMAGTLAQARTPIRQWWVAMPDSVMPLLTKNNRLDFIDFLDSKMEAVVTNRLDGKSQMNVLTDDYLHISYTRTCDVAMKLLPVADTVDVLCMVTTVKAAADDSHVAFFDESWNPIEASTLFVEPALDDFREGEVCDSTDAAWRKMDIFFKTYELSPDAPTLTCRLGAADYLGEEDRRVVMPYLKCDALVYSWEDGRFVRKP